MTIQRLNDNIFLIGFTHFAFLSIMNLKGKSVAINGCKVSQLVNKRLYAFFNNQYEKGMVIL